MNFVVVPHDPNWVTSFATEAARIRTALDDSDIEVHHIGSTAIPGIYAKPIIDILLVVRSLSSLDSKSPAMSGLGYEAMGEFGIVGRRYFRRNTGNGIRTHHVHAFERNSEGAIRHLAFRDYMQSHPGAAKAYSVLKQKLAMDSPQNTKAYLDGKAAFIRYHESLAIEWFLRRHKNA